MSVITMIPSRDSGNVYNVLLYRALEGIGLHYVQIPFSWRYLLRHRPQAPSTAFTHAPDVRAEAERGWGRREHVHTIPMGAAKALTRRRLRARRRGNASASRRTPSPSSTSATSGRTRGIDTLLDAFRALQSAHPEAHLILAGQPYSEEFSRLFSWDDLKHRYQDAFTAFEQHALPPRALEE